MPAPPSPRPTPSWTGSPAYPPAHPPPHTGLCPRSNSRADTAPCPPMPSQRADIGQEHPRLAVGHLPQPPAVLPGHSHRLPPLLGKVAAVPAPTPLPDAPAGFPGTPAARPIITSSSQGESVRTAASLGLTPERLRQVLSVAPLPRLYQQGLEIMTAVLPRLPAANSGAK